MMTFSIGSRCSRKKRTAGGGPHCGSHTNLRQVRGGSGADEERQPFGCPPRHHVAEAELVLGVMLGCPRVLALGGRSPVL